MCVEQEVGRHHDGRQHVVEVVRDAAGELPDRLHFLLLLHAIFQRALRGGLERIDDGRLAVAILILNRGDEEIRPPFVAAGKRGLDRRDIALTGGGLCDRGLQCRAVAVGHDRENRALIALEHDLEG